MNSSELNNLSLDIVKQYVESGRTDLMSADLVNYISLLELSRTLYKKSYSKDNIIKLLTSEPYSLSKYTAKKIFDDSINFFSLDSSVAKEAWYSVYADKLDNLALLAIHQRNFDTARSCFNDAVKYRVLAIKQADINDQLKSQQRPLYVIDPEVLGISKPDRNKVRDYIDSLPDVPESDRERLHRDALTGKNTFFVEIEEITPDESEEVQ